MTDSNLVAGRDRDAAGVLIGGIDVGPSSIKSALFLQASNGIEALAANLTRVRGVGVPADYRSALRTSWADLLRTAGVLDADVTYVASTGVRDQVAFRVGHYYGRVSQGMGTRFLFPGAAALLDCGACELRGAVLDADGRVIRQLSCAWDDAPAGSAARVAAMVAALRFAGPLALVGDRSREREWLAHLRMRLGEGTEPRLLLSSGDSIFASAYGAGLLAARRYRRLAGDRRRAQRRLDDSALRRLH